MSKIELLPEEILLKIFIDLEAVNDLTQCRLVCRRWDKEAEAAIFGNQKVVLKSNSQALGLYGHLYKDLDNGGLIRHLHLDASCSGISDFLLAEIVGLAMTPNLKYFTGVVTDDRIFDTIIKVANTLKYTTLKEIPYLKRNITSTYGNALCKFKHTLETIHLGYEADEPHDPEYLCFIHHLPDFKNLTEMYFAGIFQEIGDIELVLERCIRLKTLTLEVTINNHDPEYKPGIAAEVLVVTSLRKLTVINECLDDFLKYLVYKYPLVQELSIDSKLCRLSSDIHIFTNNMNGIMQSIRSIPLKSMRLILQLDGNFMDIVNYFSTINCTIVIEKPVNRTMLLLRIEGL